ncbi:MAG: TauD/TfdA family dioxygenase, partial [Burkholderiaceae bacterium]
MTKTTQTNLSTIACSSPIGAEVRGIQISQGLTNDEYAFVKKSLNQYGVVFLRNQEVSPEHQRAFAQGIGTLRPL